MNAERRKLLLALSSVAPGAFKKDAGRSIKSEGQGKILKIVAPRRAVKGYPLVVFVAYHKNLEAVGAAYAYEVHQKLKELGLTASLKSTDPKFKDDSDFITHQFGLIETTL